MFEIKFAGLDIAQRVDNAALEELTFTKDKVLEETGSKIWGHIDFSVVGADLGKIWKLERHSKIGYDRTGIGDMAQKLMPSYLPLHPIVLSAPMKIEIINLLGTLFSRDLLVIHTQELYDEIVAQEKNITPAGNITYNHPQGRHDDRFWALGCAAKVAVDTLTGTYRPRVRATTGRPELDLESRIQKDINTLLNM